MSAQPFDPIADLHMAVEQIKREPKPQPDMVPWDEYNWRDRKRGKRRSQQRMNAAPEAKPTGKT